MTADSLYTISIDYRNTDIESILSSMPHDTSAYTRHYTHGEDFFLRLPHRFTVPQFSIHHPATEKKADKLYIQALIEVLTQLRETIPHIFSGLSWYFNPVNIFHPAFYSLYTHNKNLFLFLLQLDLGFRPQYHTMVQRGNNDLTHGYSTNELFMEASLIPVENTRSIHAGKTVFSIKNLISETWIGETGRGYRVKGIWMDDDLSSFFSRLFLYPGKRLYPYFPFLCKYRTICGNIIFRGPEDPAAQTALLDAAIALIEPEIPTIQHTLRKQKFSEELELFQAMKKSVPTGLYAHWDNVIVEFYLNTQGLREYLVSEKT